MDRTAAIRAFCDVTGVSDRDLAEALLDVSCLRGFVIGVIAGVVVRARNGSHRSMQLPQAARPPPPPHSRQSMRGCLCGGIVDDVPSFARHAALDVPGQLPLRVRAARQTIATLTACVHFDLSRAPQSANAVRQLEHRCCCLALF